MASNWRTPGERARDTLKISEWYLAGKSQFWMAQELTDLFYPDHPMTRVQVGYDLRKIVKEWEKDQKNNIDHAKVMELEKINHLEEVYWTAWEDSKKELTSTVTSRIGEKASARIQKYNRDGNAQYLAGVQWCIETRAKILGIFAPVKNENVNVDLSTMTDDQLEQIANGVSLYTVLAGKGGG